MLASKLKFFVLQSGVRLVRGIVKDVEEKKILLGDGTAAPYGLLGVGPSAFIKSLAIPKSPSGSLEGELLHALSYSCY